MSSAPTSSRAWSCGALQDGITHVSSEAKRLEEEAAELDRQIKDQRYMVFRNHCNQLIVFA